MKRQTLWLTQGDPHRIYVRDAAPGVVVRAQVRSAEGDLAGSYVLEDGSTPAEQVYVLPGAVTAGLLPGSRHYVWEMEVLAVGESETMIGGGVFVAEEVARP
jgi:hypothetical protein